MYSTIKNWSEEKKNFVSLVTLAVVFFFIYSTFYLTLPPKFNSPDETSNHFFIKLYEERGTLRVFEPLNFIAQNRIQPRSMAVVNGYLVPGGFLGIILIYGWLAKIFGLKIIFVLTPLFIVLAIFCFYEILKKVFNIQIAFWSAVLMFFHPAIWYYSARGLFPNVLFISLLIFGFYFLQRGFTRTATRIYAEYILAGLFFGLALTVRLSEIIWIGGALLILFLIYRKNLKWPQVALFFIFAVLTFSPIFAYNQIFYNSPFLTAYNLGDENIRSMGGGDADWLVSFARYVFPFGFDIKNILKNFSNYFVGMFWWLAIPLAVGVLWQIKKLIDGKLDDRQKTYLLLYCFIALFLFCYYGSWMFYDNPAREVSIGTSYIRYWLPIYILSLPFVVLALSKLINWLGREQKKLMAAALVMIYFLLSIKLTFLDPNDGLSKARENVQSYYYISRAVNQLIEPEAIIVVDVADKIFFPEYKVIWPLRDDQVYKLIPELAKIVPLYYYGITLPQSDIDYLYAKKIDPNKVEIIKVRDFGVESLYRFEHVE